MNTQQWLFTKLININKKTQPIIVVYEIALKVTLKYVTFYIAHHVAISQTGGPADVSSPGQSTPMSSDIKPVKIKSPFIIR